MLNYATYLTNIFTIPSLSSYLNIPASTLYKYAAGTYRPSAARNEYLRNEYGKLMYQEMRGSGVPKASASYYRYHAPGSIDNIIERTRIMAEQSARRHNRPVEYVIQGYYESEYTIGEIEDWY